MNGMNLSRRQFVQTSIAAAAAMGAPATGVLGANDQLRIAIIGVRGRGNGHIDWFGKIDGVKIVALCDPDEHVLADRAKKVEGVDTYTDMREVFDRKDIDAIVCATPNHWHSLCGIWAVQSGKHAYVEKPISHNIFEGRQLANAAAKYGKVVQVGIQTRSDGGTQGAIEYAQSGKLGKITLVTGLCYKKRDNIGNVSGPTALPSHIDYNLWCGPAEMKPLMRKDLHYDWHWVWNTGNGDIGNQGAHQIDVCRRAVSQPGHPPRIIAIGGRFGYEDDANTANTQIVYYDYDPVPMIFEVRGLPTEKSREKTMDRLNGVNIGNVIQCEGGYIPLGAAGGGWSYDNDGKRIEQFAGSGGGNHAKVFIDAVRANDPTKVNGDAVEGHISASLCHLGNISYRVGRRQSMKEIESSISSNAALSESFGRMRDHLQKNEVDLERTPATLGASLEFDNETERFTGGEMADAANMLVSRNYREPFVVPDEV